MYSRGRGAGFGGVAGGAEISDLLTGRRVSK